MKLGTVVMFGVGYVLGSKAGQERYEQICRMAQTASERLEAYSLDQERPASGSDAERSGRAERHAAAL
jgi:hypothetical protein